MPAVAPRRIGIGIVIVIDQATPGSGGTSRG
jgi:hypothetical protein